MNDRPKRPVETSQEWLRYAEEDFGVAEREMLSEEPAYHTICFLCQSAAEKFLKGYLIAQGSTAHPVTRNSIDRNVVETLPTAASAWASIV